jgi:hypothetical protein
MRPAVNYFSLAVMYQLAGLNMPTDGNVYAAPRTHTTPEFSPISQYERKGESPQSFNVGTTYQRGPSIDDKVLLPPHQVSNIQLPQYFSTTNVMQYVQ